MNLEQIAVRLDRDQLRRIDAVALKQGKSRAEVIRLGLETFLETCEGQQTNLNRMAQAIEFIQLALDLIVTRDMPDKRDPIMNTVAKRMEQFHGSR